MDNQENNIRALDYLTIFSAILQVFNYVENARQTTNDVILKELRHQDEELFAKVLKNQEELNKRFEKIEKILESKG